MPVWIEGRTHFFVCDVCRHEATVDEEDGTSWDEAKFISARMKEEGWRLSKRRGAQWEAQCPDCAQHSGYTLGPEGLD